MAKIIDIYPIIRKRQLEKEIADFEEALSPESWIYFLNSLEDDEDE